MMRDTVIAVAAGNHMKKTILLTLVGISAISSAVTLPYSTGFENSEVPSWTLAGSAASNVNWSSMNNWRMSNAQVFAGAQSLNAGATTTNLPASVVNPSSVPVSAGTGILKSNAKMYMSSTFNGGATGANAVYGMASRVTYGSFSSTLNRFGVQNNGNVVIQNNFAYSTIGTISGFQNQWLDISLVLDATNPQIGYTLTVKDAANATLFNGSGNLRTTNETNVTIDYMGLFYANNGGTGSALTGNVYFDNMSIEAVPEPATLTILGLGVAALLRRRKK